jgi:DNA adenine methylase
MWKSLVAGKKMPNRIERDFYSDVRDCFNGKNNKYDDDIIGWVGYMGSFNGRFFDGGYSGHNVMGTNGKARDYISENIANTLQQPPFLNDVFWQSGDYFAIDIPEGSLIYCDPPYKDTKQYQFSRDFDYQKFYDWCRKMVADGHTLFVSEYNMPDDFECVWSKEITNAMHQTNTKKAVEKLFVIRK